MHQNYSLVGAGRGKTSRLVITGKAGDGKCRDRDMESVIETLDYEEEKWDRVAVRL